MRHRAAALCLAAVALPRILRSQAPALLFRRRASASAPAEASTPQLPTFPGPLRLSDTAKNVLRLSSGAGTASDATIAGLNTALLFAARQRAASAPLGFVVTVDKVI